MRFLAPIAAATAAAIASAPIAQERAKAAADFSAFLDVYQRGHAAFVCFAGGDATWMNPPRFGFEDGRFWVEEYLHDEGYEDWVLYQIFVADLKPKVHAYRRSCRLGEMYRVHIECARPCKLRADLLEDAATPPGEQATSARYGGEFFFEMRTAEDASEAVCLLRRLLGHAPSPDESSEGAMKDFGVDGAPEPTLPLAITCDLYAS